MLAALADNFGDGAAGVQWSAPAGGFFITVTLLFDFGQPELRRCTLDYGVTVCPMRFFCLGASRKRQALYPIAHDELLTLEVEDPSTGSPLSAGKPGGPVRQEVLYKLRSVDGAPGQSPHEITVARSCLRLIPV